jgi:hypothetical protein
LIHRGSEGANAKLKVDGRAHAFLIALEATGSPGEALNSTISRRSGQPR